MGQPPGDAFMGHSFPALSRVRVITYADYWHGGAATTVWDDATGCMRQPTGWVFSPATTIMDPYLRIQVTLPNVGTAFRYPQIAEMFLGRTWAFPRSARPGWQTEWKEDQPRQVTKGGVWISRGIQYPVRKLPLELDLAGGVSPEEWPAIRDEVMAGTGMGAHPCPLLPAWDTEPE
jgi:hypothetical protein